MNVSTKTWLMELLDKQADMIASVDRTEMQNGRVSLEMEMARVDDARRLVDQMPEEPTR